VKNFMICLAVEGYFAKPLLAAVPYQCCPKCEGQGIVAKPSWVAAGVNNWSSTSAVHQCDVCNGAKIIPMYIVPTETKVVENGG
jgi:hypothetical protein